MKLLAAIVLVLTSLTGCIAYSVPYDHGPSRGDYRGQHRGQGDRDGDGVPNRDDRRPNNPNRY